MSRWWRAYDEAVDDPKLQRLPAPLFKSWFNLMCIASLSGGVLPPIEDVAFKLHVSKLKAELIVSALIAAGLFDKREDEKIEPHNWTIRQFKSDVTDPTAAERMRRYRKKRNSVTEENVTVTPPRVQRQSTETEAETEKNSEPTGSTAEAPRDIRKDLFGKGLETLANITGKTPDSARSLVGRWLKAVNDEAIHVLGAIENAERNRVADPVAWITRALQQHTGDRHGKRSVQDAARDIAEKFGAVSPGDSGAAGGSPVRLLPAR